MLAIDIQPIVQVEKRKIKMWRCEQADRFLALATSERRCFSRWLKW